MRYHGMDSAHTKAPKQRRINTSASRDGRSSEANAKRSSNSHRGLRGTETLVMEQKNGTDTRWFLQAQKCETKFGTGLLSLLSCHYMSTIVLLNSMICAASPPLSAGTRTRPRPVFFADVKNGG